MAGKLPCESCGSSDAVTEYDDHFFCFSCRDWDSKEDNNSSVDSIEFEEDFKFQAIPARCLTAETLKKFHYGIKDNSHIATYYSQQGKRVAQHIRTVDKNFYWKGSPKNVQLFGQNLWNPGKRLVITEGELDCLSVAQVFNLKWPVVSLPNGSGNAEDHVKANLEFIEGFEEVVLAFDGDDAGLEAVHKVAPLITPGKVKVVSYPAGYKDASDLVTAGRSNQLTSMIFEAKSYRPDGVINGTELWGCLKDFYDGTDDHEVYTLPYPILQEMTQGIRKREIVTVTAGTGIGKSTLVNEIGFDLLKQGAKIGVMALEESCKRSALRYMSIACNTPLHINKESVSPEAYEKAYRETVGTGNLYFYDHFGSLEQDNLTSKMRYLMVSCECDFVILDHISIAVSGLKGDNERRIIDNLMTDLRSLVESTGAGAIIVCHLSRTGDSVPHEEGARVKLNHLRGSQAIAQLSDRVWACERDQQSATEGNQMQIRSLKDRYTGLTGPADVLEYINETGRLDLLSKSEDF